MTLSKKSILLRGRADGGRAYLVFAKYLLEIYILFFDFFFIMLRI